MLLLVAVVAECLRPVRPDASKDSYFMDFGPKDQLYQVEEGMSHSMEASIEAVKFFSSEISTFETCAICIYIYIDTHSQPTHPSLPPLRVEGWVWRGGERTAHK